MASKNFLNPEDENDQNLDQEPAPIPLDSEEQPLPPVSADPLSAEAPSLPPEESYKTLNASARQRLQDRAKELAAQKAGFDAKLPTENEKLVGALGSGLSNIGADYLAANQVANRSIYSKDQPDYSYQIKRLQDTGKELGAYAPAKEAAVQKLRSAAAQRADELGKQDIDLVKQARTFEQAQAANKNAAKIATDNQVAQDKRAEAKNKVDMDIATLNNTSKEALAKNYSLGSVIQAPDGQYQVVLETNTGKPTFIRATDAKPTKPGKDQFSGFAQNVAKDKTLVGIQTALNNAQDVFDKYRDKGGIPGVTGVSGLAGALTRGYGRTPEESQNVQAVQAIENIITLLRAGTAVSKQEAERIEKELKGSPIVSFATLENGLKLLGSQAEAKFRAHAAANGYGSEDEVNNVINDYNATVFKRPTPGSSKTGDAKSTAPSSKEPLKLTPPKDVAPADMNKVLKGLSPEKRAEVDANPELLYETVRKAKAKGLL